MIVHKNLNFLIVFLTSCGSKPVLHRKTFLRSIINLIMILIQLYDSWVYFSFNVNLVAADSVRRGFQTDSNQYLQLLVSINDV